MSADRLLARVMDGVWLKCGSSDKDLRGYELLLLPDAEIDQYARRYAGRVVFSITRGTMPAGTRELARAHGLSLLLHVSSEVGKARAALELVDTLKYWAKHQ